MAALATAAPIPTTHEVANFVEITKRSSITDVSFVSLASESSENVTLPTDQHIQN
jgi:hypothetical protein